MNGKGKFLTHLTLTPRPDGRKWRNDAPFAYAPAAGGHITVPEGFVTDLASIPPLAWVGSSILLPAALLIPLFWGLGLGLSLFITIALFVIGAAIILISPLFLPFGKYTEAAVLHDWLYRRHLFTRKASDDLLLEAMGVCGVPGWQSRVIYSAVRAFGWSAWNNEPRRIGYIQKQNIKII